MHITAAQSWSHVWHLLIAFALAIPIGLNREIGARSAGIRTFPLVAVASCGYILTGLYVLQGFEAQSRLMYGLMVGIGFIGGGAIIKSKMAVTGTATAASIWNMGAIGLTVAWDRYEIAITLMVLNFLTLYLGAKIKQKLRPGQPPEGSDTIRDNGD